MAQNLDPQQLLALGIALAKTKAEEIIEGLVGKITKGKRVLKFREEKDKEIAELKAAVAQTNENVARVLDMVKALTDEDHEKLAEICEECQAGSTIELEQE
jgi:acetate kinase